MRSGRHAAVGTTNSAIVPLGVIRPILLPLSSANQRLPSGPVTIPCGTALGVGRGNWVIVPAGDRRMILPVCCSVIHRLPSGPLVISLGAQQEPREETP